MKRILHLLARLRFSQRGSAMTEFVIGLPIFVMIFIGMGMLYKYNNEGLVARMKTVTALSKVTTAPNTVAGFVPVVGGMSSISSFGDVYQNGLSGLGMYYDSWGKASLPETILPGQTIAPPASPPVKTIDEITGLSTGSDQFTNDLLNDMLNPTWDSSGWAGILMSVVKTLGVGPSIAAGIRYGAVDAEESHSFTHTWGGQVTYNPGKIDLPAPTAAHHRIVAVAISRLEMNTEQPYKDSILEFNVDMDLSGNPGADTSGSDSTTSAAQACGADATAWQSCLDDADAAGLNSFDKELMCSGLEPDSSCEDIASQQMEFSTTWCGAGCPQP